MARRLGLSPSSLLDEEPIFLWRDEAKFKNLDVHTGHEEAALTSFGLIIGRTLFSATSGVPLPDLDAPSARNALLASNPYVDLRALLLLSWSLGIPVVHLRVFPLDSKHIHAMTVQHEGRYVILLAHNSASAAQHAFTLAHELGHIFLRHFVSQSAIVDMTNPVSEQTDDDEELAANRFALELLTGHAEFEAHTMSASYTSAQLAAAALLAGPDRRIDPGMLALSLGHTTKKWLQTSAALKIIQMQQPPAPSINGIAEREVRWSLLSDENEGYLRRVLGLGERGLA